MRLCVVRLEYLMHKLPGIKYITLVKLVRTGLIGFLLFKLKKCLNKFSCLSVVVFVLIYSSEGVSGAGRIKFKTHGTPSFLLSLEVI